MGVIVFVLTFRFFIDRIGSLYGGRSRLEVLFEGFGRTRHILVFVVYKFYHAFDCICIYLVFYILDLQCSQTEIR